MSGPSAEVTDKPGAENLHARNGRAPTPTLVPPNSHPTQFPMRLRPMRAARTIAGTATKTATTPATTQEMVGMPIAKYASSRDCVSTKLISPMKHEPPEMDEEP